MQYPHTPQVTGAAARCEQQDARCQALQQESGATLAARPLRIVLAEDNRDAADTLRMLLEMSGHTVWLAETGPAAVDAVRQHAPDLLVCDIGLPGMTGYEVARTLRQDPQFCGLPMFACSGYSDSSHRIAAAQAGFDRHFSKAGEPLAMLAEVERLAVGEAIQGMAQ